MFGAPSRREFLKGSAALLAALSLSAWFPQPRRAAAQGCPAQPEDGFTCLPSQLATGQPVADIAAGWDGVQWAVDTLGVPHYYDPLQQTWTLFGDGVDAATLVGAAFYLFRGGEVAIYDSGSGQSTVQPISALWPGLPASFTSDLDGAFANGQTLYLCRGGRYVAADLSANPVTFSAPSPLNTWPLWPASDPWGQGVLGRCGTWIDPSLPVALLFGVQTPPAAYLKMFLTTYGTIEVDAIGGLGEVIPPATAQIVNSLTAGDFDAYITQTNMAPFPNTHWLFQGPVVWKQVNSAPDSGSTTPIPLASLAPTWFPALKQAPRGRVGSLWSVTTAGAVVYHDGQSWNTTPAIPGATALGVDVGEDGTPFAIGSSGGGAALYPFDVATAAWQPPIALGTITPRQVAVGDASRVYVLGEDGAVSRLVGGSFAPVAELAAGVAHVTANHDGTLWHCDGVTANAFRYIAEQPYLSSLPIPGVTSITQVASTAYGDAFLLVQQAGAGQLYHYSSPAIFKTSPSFVPIVDGPVLQHPQVTAGGGRCFVNLGSGIAALDSHTGAQLWLASAPAGSSFAAMTYDPLHGLLYVTDGNVTLLALDGATGAPVWTFQVGSSPISQPALSGAGLCVVGNVTVYWFDTGAALAAARGNPPQAVAPVWSVDAVDPPGASWAAALIEANAVTVTLMVGGDPVQYTTVTLAAQDGSMVSNGIIAVQLAEQVTPLLGRGQWLGNWQTLSLINAGFGIWAFPAPFVANSVSHLSPAPAASGGFGRGLALFDGVLYAGGANGILYSLASPDGSAAFQPLLEAAITDGGFAAGPVAAPGGQGGAVIVFSGRTGSSNNIWIYDPVTTDLVQIDTDQLLATQLTVDTNGVLYAAGNPGTAFGQVYALRIDAILQGERDFIVDSELMQDFDEPASGQLAATPRYQTHVTVVDALKAPQPFQSVKVWADTTLLTLVQIDGQPYFINQTTPAAVQTDAAGTLTVVSDAADLSTTPLKLWAGFMNPHERIVVYPDRAFHARLATTDATPNSTNSDPTRINLSTATTYDVTNLTNPPPLFAANEQPQASAAATAVQQLTTATGYGAGVTPGRARRAAAPSPSRYLAYTDGPGAAYGPVNTPANRLVSALAVDGFTGFQFDGAATTLLPVVDAANAIDALAGDALAAPGSLFGWLRALWDKLKSGAAAVVRIVISVGKDLYLGLQYIEAGVTKVLRQVLRTVEDVAIAIGSVFVQLGKDIVKVAEALSLIFHLGEVVATARLLKGYFTTWAANLPQTIIAYTADIQTTLGDLQTSITDGLQSLITYFDGGQLALASPAASPAIGGLQGMGQTPHTAFTITPQSGAPAQPVAVPAMWGAHKLRGNLKTPSGATLPDALPGNAPDFVAAFLSSFVSDTNLQQALSNAKQQFDNSFHPTSAKAFFGQAIGDVLSIIEVIAALAVDGISAGVNAVLDNLSAVSAALGTWSSAEIPVLSTLLGLLGLQDVTFLDILLFVAAIPVTLVYRIRYGTYPAASATRENAGANAEDVTPAVLATVVGIMGGVLNMVNGIFAAIVDADATIGDALSKAESNVKLVLGVGLALVTSATYIAGDVASATVWVILASVVNILQAFLGLWSPAADSPPSLAMVPSIYGSLMSTPLLLLAYVEQWEATKDALNLAAGVVSTLALFVNPLKFGGDVAAVALVVDIVAGMVSGALALLDTLASQPPTDLPITAEPPPLDARRLYMPAISQQP